MKKYSIKSRFFTFISIFIFILSIQVAPSGNAAYTITPKVGQCFSLTPAQVSAAYATKNPIKCSSTHNSETYEVAVWPLDTNPADMEYKDAISIVAELCDFGIHIVLQNKVDGAKQNLIIGLGIHQILPAGHEVKDG